MLTTISKSATLPVSLAELKQHLGITHTTTAAEDTHLTAILWAAIDWAAAGIDGGRTIVETQYRLSLPDFVCYQRLPLPPLQSVESVKYYTDETLTTMDSADYLVHTPTDTQGLVEFLYSAPAVDVRLDAVQIVYTAGYTTLPYTLRAAILLLAAHLNENREAVIVGTISAPLPLGVQNLLGASGWGYVA